MTLEKLAEKYHTDKFEHGYCPYYERHLASLQQIARPRLLEIGVWRGGSLAMWCDWLGPDCDVYGLDIDLSQMDIGSRAVVIQGDVLTWSPDHSQLPPLDVVIDDGDHHWTHIQAGLEKLWSRLRPGGWYVIEDTATQFSERWGGGSVRTLEPYGSPVTDLVLDKASSLMGDEGPLKVHWIKGTGPSDLSELHVYPQIVFMRKRV